MAIDDFMTHLRVFYPGETFISERTPYVMLQRSDTRQWYACKVADELLAEMPGYIIDHLFKGLFGDNR